METDELHLMLYIRSLSISEHRELRTAAEKAETADMITYLYQGGRKIAAIVPVRVAESYGKPLPAVCTACLASRHEDCVQDDGGEICDCDYRSIHRALKDERNREQNVQAALYRMARGH